MELTDEPSHSFFSNSANGAPNPLRANVTKLFDRLRDDPRNEPDEINAEGTQKMLGEMDIGLDDIGALVFSELVQSPSLGKVTREGFIDGCLEVSADSIPKLRNAILQRRSQLSTNKDTFRPVYNHTFILGLANGQKALAQEDAREFWTLLFSKQGYEWRTRKTPWLIWWLEFQEEKWKKAINKDLWRQTLTFAEETLKDETLGFWTEESSWPSVIDDFVAWVKTEKRGGGEAMDVE